MIKKTGEAIERRGSMVKCGEALLEGAFENPVEFSMCDTPMELSLSKSGSLSRGKVGWNMVEYCSQRCQ